MCNFAASFDRNDRTYKDVELNVLSAAYGISQILTYPHGKATANVHCCVYTTHVYINSVGFGVAYSRVKAMREPHKRDK